MGTSHRENNGMPLSSLTPSRRGQWPFNLKDKQLKGAGYCKFKKYRPQSSPGDEVVVISSVSDPTYFDMVIP